MTKAELIDLYKEATGLSKKDAAEHLERLGDICAAELLAGGEVTLPRIGKLVVKARAERMGRNPATGQAITIPARKAVMLKVAKELKESLQ